MQRVNEDGIPYDQIEEALFEVFRTEPQLTNRALARRFNCSESWIRSRRIKWDRIEARKTAEDAAAGGPEEHSGGFEGFVQHEFYGAIILGIAGDTAQESWVFPKTLSDGMGLDWRAQQERMARDHVMKTRTRVLRVQIPGDTQVRDHTLLRLDTVNWFLAGIQANSMEDPAARELVVGYQLECAAALYAHFLKKSGRDESGAPVGDMSREILLLAGSVEELKGLLVKQGTLVEQCNSSVQSLKPVVEEFGSLVVEGVSDLKKCIEDGVLSLKDCIESGFSGIFHAVKNGCGEVVKGIATGFGDMKYWMIQDEGKPGQLMNYQGAMVGRVVNSKLDEHYKDITKEIKSQNENIFERMVGSFNSHLETMKNTISSLGKEKSAVEEERRELFRKLEEQNKIISDLQSKTTELHDEVLTTAAMAYQMGVPKEYWSGITGKIRAGMKNYHGKDVFMKWTDGVTLVAYRSKFNAYRDAEGQEKADAYMRSVGVIPFRSQSTF